MFLIIEFFLVSNSHDVHACSCIETTELQALERSSTSFIGTPVKIESPLGFNNIVTFQVERPIKNMEEGITKVTVITHAQDSACGYNFEGNSRYLVHTYGEKDQKTLETGLCSGNENLGFSSISLLSDESVLKNYPTSVSLYPIILFLIIFVIISVIVIVIIGYRKKKNLKSNIQDICIELLLFV
jgi:hypothetical protein